MAFPIPEADGGWGEEFKRFRIRITKILNEILISSFKKWPLENVLSEFPGGIAGEGSGIITAAAWVTAVAWVNATGSVPGPGDFHMLQARPRRKKFKN